jgi:hypothetical protein
VSIGRVGQSTMIAALSKTGDIAVASSADGVTYVPDSRIAVTAALLGTLTQSPQHRAVLAMTRVTIRHGIQQPVITVASRSGAGGWSLADVSVVPRSSSGGIEASTPSLAVDSGGTSYVTWSTSKAVFLSTSRDLKHWSPAVKVSGAQPSVLPTIAAGGPGRVALAFYSTLSLRTTADDPYAGWFVAVAQSSNGNLAHPRFTFRLATPAPVHTGVICWAASCAAPSMTLPSIGHAPSMVGPPVIALGLAGDIEVAFVAQADALGNLTAGLGFIRSCAAPTLLSRGPRPRCAGKSGAGMTAPPAPAGDDGAQIPPVPPIVTCGVAPPPFPHPQPVPVDKPAPQPPAPHTHPQPHPAPAPMVVPPVVPEPPAQPALPPGQAPASAQQLGQAQQPGNASQPGGQAGLSVAEEEQARESRSYAASRNSSPYPSVAYLWAWTFALMAAGGALAVRQRSARPARVHTRSSSQAIRIRAVQTWSKR